MLMVRDGCHGLRRVKRLRTEIPFPVIPESAPALIRDPWIEGSFGALEGSVLPWVPALAPLGRDDG